jgi:DNA-3-methyladenine glycosylase II
MHKISCSASRSSQGACPPRPGYDAMVSQPEAPQGFSRGGGAANDSRRTCQLCSIIPFMPQRTARPPAYDISRAVTELSQADAKLARLIERAGPFTLKLGSAQSPFEALLRAIVYQQLNGRAAETIHRRLLDSFVPVTGTHRLTGEAVHFTAQHLLDAPNEQLRGAGLSHNKALAVRDLAAKTLDGTVPNLARIRRMTDEQIIEHLTQVRGVGRWTVEMFLIFRLGRPDVLPVSDYGVRKGFALTFGKLKPADKVTPADLPSPAIMERRAARWKPWRSVASWYLWRACDLAAGKLVQPE